VLKLDNDHAISPDFLDRNSLDFSLDARLGSWRLAKSPDQAYVNGAFYATKESLAAVGYFNEAITTYGWDDSYLHEALFASGARLGHLDPDSITHIEQEESQRTGHQKVSVEAMLAETLNKKPTEFMNRRNMYFSAMLPRQGRNISQSTYETVQYLKTSGLSSQVMIRTNNPASGIDPGYTFLANVLAYRDFYCWNCGMAPGSVAIADAIRLHPLFVNGAEENSNSGIANSTILTAAARLNSSSISPAAYIQRRPRPVCTCPKPGSLWRILPAACSLYGHTDNTRRYTLAIDAHDLSNNEIETFNYILPGWAREKVSFSNLPSGENTAIESDFNKRELVFRLLTDNTGNQYFWAVFNSLTSSCKRSLYEFLEKAGKPFEIITYCVAEKISSGEYSKEAAHKYLSPISRIYPGRKADYSRWVKKFCGRLEAVYDKTVATLVKECLSQTTESGQADEQITLVTSLFKGSSYLPEYCINLKRMHLFGRTRIDIHVVPSSEASYQIEFLENFFSGDSNVVVYERETDPGLYECWNISARNASTEFMGNANVDDRRGRYHSDYLVYFAALNDYDAVASALLVDSVPCLLSYNDTQDVWFTGMGKEIKLSDMHISEGEMISSRNYMHCMPIWRVDLHREIGYFDEGSYGTSADWEFWLRALTAKRRLALNSMPLGCYLIAANSHNRRRVNERKEKECRIVNKYIDSNVIPSQIIAT
jgi:hypothetical protein